MIHVSIQHNQYRNYTRSSEGIVTGSAFYLGEKYSEGKLLELISAWDEEKRFIEGLKQMNGFYALIKKKDQQLFAAVDRLRSIPLFYAKVGLDFYLSDSADWVRHQVGNSEMDPVAREEFLLTGYVTGSDTLFPDVKQLQAGEALMVYNDCNTAELRQIRYYCFIHAYGTSKKMEELRGEHDKVLLRAFKRLIETANGRTLVAPLSGGHDSRLIVLMLKRLGYENLIAFSYGRNGNAESVVSKQIADALGIRWEFVEYNNDLWYQWYRSEDYSKYKEFASGSASLPHIQDWPAVWQLKKENRLPLDSIFIPGHSADLLAGSRSEKIPELYVTKPPNNKKIINGIFRMHYSLIDWASRKNLLGPIFMTKLWHTIGALEQFPDSASALERWDISERQAKFIINSVRAYEYWGFSWWMPFWDYEYVQFWCSVPLKFRIQQRMYKKFVDDLSVTLIGRIIPTSQNPPSYIRDFKKVLVGFLNISMREQIKKILVNDKKFLHNAYYSHPLAYWGVCEYSNLLMRESRPANINAVLASDFIKDYK